MPTPFELREELIDLLRLDLVGPADGEEEELTRIETRVTRRYPLGALAPGGSAAASGADASEEDVSDEERAEAEAETAAIDGDEGEETGPTEREPVLVDSLLPSSVGFSCMVDGQEKSLLVRAELGRYERVSSDTQKDEKSGAPLTVWKRVPVRPEPWELNLVEGSGSVTLDAEPKVLVRWRIRRREDIWHVSLFLVNAQARTQRKQDECWIFQAAMSVESGDGQERPVFVSRPLAGLRSREQLDPNERREMEGLELRYRHCQTFGKGHGCAVKSHQRQEDAPDRARKLELDLLPVAHVPGQTSRTEKDDPLLRGVVLDMASLSDMPKDELLASLGRMADAYAAWVDGLPDRVYEAAFAETARRAQEDARRALDHMREGIAVLRDDADALKAFRFANKAMHYQRVHSIYAHQVQGRALTGEDRRALLKAINHPINRSWRLFQLAFVLCNIPTLANPLHKERSGVGSEAVAELLWFATGGGKTEAYLGLTAFTLAMRRLRPNLGGLDAMHGVGVFMRYTLRLLTLQQFQRAAALICACEILRRHEPDVWGMEPFRLGLWVGSKSTPNTLERADQQLNHSRGGLGSQSGSPAQFSTCPWCGAPTSANDVRVGKTVTTTKRCITYCGDSDGNCPFSRRQSPEEGLPVMVVDEEIYRHPPALLISTVDKFAQMPWKGEVEMLFGRVAGHCPRHGFTSPDVPEEEVGSGHRKYGQMPAVTIEAHCWLRPPDLIIQDELHLISGPLGSMTGLYENAVDTLCQWELDGHTVRPKVIASTATIRRASAQVQQLFNRCVEVFPPPGVDSRDNFFSLERPVGPECPGRVYMGICPTGNRMPPMTVRVYATVMAAAQLLYEKFGALADPWMTTVGYFNSVRELAGTRRLVEDEVRHRLKDKFQRGLAPRRVKNVEELTSRQGSHKIPYILDRLATSFEQEPTPAGAPPRSPYDVVLATNMISVGVDIERLGLMVMLGQPKTTSEYIQASSRVGRSANGPGLVLTIYNWARPRDLSHFEDFFSYHTAFQRHVEALSVTPYASRALDRGLAGVVVSLVRLLEIAMNRNTAAKDFPQHEELWDRACQSILARANVIAQETSVVEDIRKRLERLRDEWHGRVRQSTASGLAYKATGDASALLKPSDMAQELFACPNSLRDVEKNVDLLLDMDPGGLSTRELE